MAAYRALGRLQRLALAFVGLGSLAGCGHLSTASLGERDCMARVMYFESIRSSDEGMMAVGTVVMNRVKSGKYPRTVCGVVGQPNQFAPGALTRPMPAGKSRDRAYRMANAVLSGRRHPSVGNAMFFHTAGRTYRFENMHYVAVAGGNAFYERNQSPGREYIPRTVIAQAGPLDSIGTSNWTMRGRLGVIDETPRAPEPSSPPVYVAAASPSPRPAPLYTAPMPRPMPAYVTSAPMQQSPDSIEALILASNGF